MATNKALERGTPLQFAAPTTVKSGDPIMLGSLACVANIDYDANTAAVSADLEGAFWLPVSAVTVISPATGSAVKPGDKIYADGGTLDGTTNVLTGFTLDKASGGVLFGTALDAITSGQTKTIRVRLKESI